MLYNIESKSFIGAFKCHLLFSLFFHFSAFLHLIKLGFFFYSLLFLYSLLFHPSSAYCCIPSPPLPSSFLSPPVKHTKMEKHLKSCKGCCHVLYKQCTEHSMAEAGRVVPCDNTIRAWDMMSQPLFVNNKVRVSTEVMFLIPRV